MRPEKTFRIGNCECAVFLNSIESDNGTQEVYNVSLHRHFFKKTEQKWDKNSSFRLADLPQAQLVLQLATDYVATREASSSGDSS